MLIDELAEELPVGLLRRLAEAVFAKLPGQFHAKGFQRGVLLERVIRVVRDVDDQATNAAAVRLCVGQQQDPGQRGVEQRQIGVRQRAAIEHQQRFVFAQAEDHLVRVVGNVVLDQRQLRSGPEGILLTLADLVLQDVFGQRFAGHA